VKNYIDFQSEGVKARDRLNRTWKKVAKGDVKSLQLSKEDSLFCSKWRRQTTV